MASIAVAFLLIGCQRVVVIDEAGKPMPGATVTVQTLSMSFPEQTDADGEVEVNGFYWQAPRWIRVTAPGYEPHQLVWPVWWPAHVSLVRAGDPAAKP